MVQEDAGSISDLSKYFLPGRRKNWELKFIGVSAIERYPGFASCSTPA